MANEKSDPQNTRFSLFVKNGGLGISATLLTALVSVLFSFASTQSEIRASSREFEKNYKLAKLEEVKSGYSDFLEDFFILYNKHVQEVEKAKLSLEEDIIGRKIHSKENITKEDVLDKKAYELMKKWADEFPKRKLSLINKYNSLGVDLNRTQKNRLKDIMAFNYRIVEATLDNKKGISLSYSIESNREKDFRTIYGDRFLELSTFEETLDYIDSIATQIFGVYAVGNKMQIMKKDGSMKVYGEDKLLRYASFEKIIFNKMKLYNVLYAQQKIHYESFNTVEENILSFDR